MGNSLNPNPAEPNFENVSMNASISEEPTNENLTHFGSDAFTG